MSLNGLADYKSAQRAPKSFDDGMQTTSYAGIKNPSFTADGPGHDTFSARFLASVLVLIPALAAWKVGGGCCTFLLAFASFAGPVLIVFWFMASRISPPINENIRGPGRPIEQYLSFKTEHDRARYWGRHKIPMETFARKYFDGEIDFNGDALDVLEYRHDWASWKFTWGIFRFVLFTLAPETMKYNLSSKLEKQAKPIDDRGTDFYAWFLGPRMLYNSGIVSDIRTEETLEEIQDNKLAAVCEKINLRPGDRLLDIGCGWGALATFASVNYGTRVAGVTLDQKQADLGNWRLKEAGIGEDQSQIHRMRLGEITSARYDKITCLEASKYVADCRMSGFFEHCYDILEEDGVFYIEVTGLRRAWQYEDLVWGLFLKKHVPEVGSLLPLGSYVTALEKAGFEVQNIDTIGYHYSATLWRWYRSWIRNADKVKAKYGEKWYRIWEYFLATATIASRQGTIASYQITLVKNLNGVHRAHRHGEQFSVVGALAKSRAAGKDRFPV